MPDPMSEMQGLPNPESFKTNQLLETAKHIAQDPLKRNLLFTAAKSSVNWGAVDQANPFVNEVAEALTAIRDTSPVDGDLDSNLRAAALRIRNGASPIVSPKIPEEMKQKYNITAAGLINEVKGLNILIGPAISERAKGHILNKIRTIGSNKGGDSQEMLSKAQVYFDKLIVAAARQNLTPEEARTTLDWERHYLRSIQRNGLRQLDRDYVAARIKLEGLAGQLSNVQKVKPEAPVQPPVQQPEFLVPEKEDNFQAFKEFTIKHASKLDTLSESDLSNYIIDHFCRRTDESPYQPGLPQTKEAAVYMKAREKWIKNRILNDPNLKLGYGNGFIFARSANNPLFDAKGKPMIPDEEMGRFYLNVKPDTAQIVFGHLFDEISRQNLMCDVKMVNPEIYDLDNSLNRSDNIVLYFGKGQKQALDLVRETFNMYASGFQSARPRFTVGVESNKGQEMAGVGFGQEPKQFKGLNPVSFSRLRANWLRSAVLEARTKGMSVSDPRFDLNECLKRKADEYGINYEHPAFNKGQVSEALYQEILKDGLGRDTGKLSPKAA